jgi:hypothetical protein
VRERMGGCAGHTPKWYAIGGGRGYMSKEGGTTLYIK